MNDKIDFWTRPATIARNNFVYKSLSCWSYNIAVGCEHGCRFCYVPEVSTRKLGKKLKEEYGVNDPDAEWGEYLLLRTWDENAFLASLREAESTPLSKLNPDGNRAVMLCTTTDPYQVVRHPDPVRRALLQNQASLLVRNALLLILERSTLNVRILTRSPLARRDFDIFKRFGDRLLFGMSLPTLDSRLARVYEPHAPAPERRLETLQAAANAGLHVFVAAAPTYPECGLEDMLATFEAIAALKPVTVFHENINIRAENIARIKAEADKVGVKLNSEVFTTPQAWAAYAQWQLNNAVIAARATGLQNRLHLWPDQSLGQLLPLNKAWFEQWWHRISEWPTISPASGLPTSMASSAGSTNPEAGV